MNVVRVIVADDEAVVRHALGALLHQQPDLRVVALAENGREAVRLCREHQPDVLLTDLQMPVMDGQAALAGVRQTCPDTAVCVLTVHDDSQSLFDALKAGARGYLLKDATPEQVAEAVRAVARGEAVLPPALAGRVLDEFGRLARRQTELQRLFEALSPREMDVLKELAAGGTNRRIAERLYLSEKTIKNHVTNILAKLHVNSRTEAALLAARGGLQTGEAGPSAER